MKSILNIVILAHVDAGKTSLTEQMLYLSGAKKSLGNVDKGTAASDFLKIERERGISVMASHISMEYKGMHINIIDTPGHIDFMSEVERSLLVADVAVLMVSAADGVQAQTHVLWDIIKRKSIPCLILLNKIDRIGVDIEAVLQEIRHELTTDVLPIQSCHIENDSFTIKSYNIEGRIMSESMVERLVEFEDSLMNDYLLDNGLDYSLLKQVYQREVQKATIFPLLFSVATSGDGVLAVLDELEESFGRPLMGEEDEFSAVVFKISYHKQWGKLTFIRIYSSVVENKQLIYNQRLKENEKVNQIKAVDADKLKDINKAVPGQLVAITGFNESQVGDILGTKVLDNKKEFTTIPILSMEVKPVDEKDYVALAEGLTELNIEDPLLGFKWYKEEKEFHIKVNGWIQIQVLESIIKERYAIDVSMKSPRIIYKETPAKIAFGVAEYTMPKPCWAVIKLKIEPLKQGSGVHYFSQVGVNDILLKYQKEVERSIPISLEQGMKAWEVTDIKITLVSGEDHVLHSRSGDFMVATPMAIMDALQKAGTQLLEPIMKFVIKAPEEILGQIASDIHRMRGTFEQPVFQGNQITIRGMLPAATSLEYPVILASKSGGKAFISMQFYTYQKVEDHLGEVNDYKGINPLDRAKYILKARKAIQ